MLDAADAVDDLRTPGAGGDKSFRIAVDVVRRAEALGFETTLIAERLRYFESIGIDCPMVHFYPMMEGLESFAAKVMPVKGR